jgi:hypothetical protein
MGWNLSLFAIAPLVIMLSGHLILPKRIAWSRAPEAFVMRHAGIIGPEDRIYSTNYLAPAIGWVLKRTNIGILGRGGELQYGLDCPDGVNHQITIPALVKQIGGRQRTRAVILILDDGWYARYWKDQPEAAQVDHGDGFVFAKYNRSGDTLGIP